MPKFDPSAFEAMMDDYIEIAHNDTVKEYKRELNLLRGLTPEQIENFGGTTSQMDDIIAEVNKARDDNLKQAELIENIKKLGTTTYDLAKKVSALVP